MAFDLSTLQPARQQAKPPRGILYAPPGVGKTTFAACAPSPIFLPTEDGLTSLANLPFDVPALPIAKTWSDVMGGLEALATQDHSFKTVAVDTLDWLEPIVWAETCRRNGWADIEAPGYGKGYLATVDVWRQFLDGLEYLRNEKGMAYLLLAHSQIRRFDSPETEPFDRYTLKLHQRASDLLSEAVDLVLFANFKTYTTSTDVGFKKSVRRGIGTGERVMFTEERPAFFAKNRHCLPAEMPFAYEALAKAIHPVASVATDQPAAEDTPPSEEGEVSNG